MMEKEDLGPGNQRVLTQRVEGVMRLIHGRAARGHSGRDRETRGVETRRVDALTGQLTDTLTEVAHGCHSTLAQLAQT